MLVASFVALATAGISTPAAGQADALPPAPPYCEAGQPQGSGGNKTSDGSTYCLDRVVNGSLAEPPEGWESHAATFSLVTAFFPSTPVGPNQPFPPNYPHIILTYHPAPDSPQFAIQWLDSLGALPMNDPNASSIVLVRIHDCDYVTDLECEYEVRPYAGGDIGDPPEWYEAQIYDQTTGIGVGIGLVADGNHAPNGALHLFGSGEAEPTVLGVAAAHDPDGDPILGYVFRWGDGQATDTRRSEATHVYNTTGAYNVTVFFVDTHGGVGTAVANVGALTDVEAIGPHVVQAGTRVAFDVTIRNAGVGDAFVGHRFGYKLGTMPPLGTIQIVDHPSFTPDIKLKPRETTTGTYVVDVLQPGTFTFSFESRASPVDCPACSEQKGSTYHEVTIQADPAPPPPSDEIFSDDFESGDLGAWSRALTDGGDLAVTDDAAIVGTKGVRAFVDDATPLYLVDTSPDGEKRYRLRFRLDPSAYAPPGRALSRILALRTSERTPGGLLFLNMRRHGAAPQLRARIRRDDGSFDKSRFVRLADGAQAIEIDWAAASSDGANDGYVTLWIDGVPKIHLPGQDNDGAGVDEVHLGLLHVPDGTSGVVTFDDVAARRVSYIGP